MNVTISGRHFEVTDGLRDHIDGGLGKVREHFDKVIDVAVTLDVERHRHIAEINLHANGLHINAKDSSDDMYVSFDSALGKIDRQVLKHKARINRHQPRTAREAREIQRKIIEVPSFHESYIGTEDSSSNGYAHSIITHHEKVPLKPLTVAEAVMQLDLMDEPFLVFYNADTDQINVVHTSPDGTYGLIEPQH